MAIISPTSLKSFFEKGDKPTEAQFGDLIDSTYSGEIGAAIVSAVSAGSTGLLQIDSASAVSFITSGTAGRAVLSANTPASIRTILSAASAGDAIFQIGTVGSVRTFIGAASTSAATTASAGLIEIATTAEASAGTDNTKAMTPATHAAVGGITLDTEQSTTSGTEFDFTVTAASPRRIVVLFEGVSLDGTDSLLVQIGDSGGLETAGYVSTSVSVSGAGSANVNSTSGFIIRVGAATRIVSGRLVLENISGDGLTWVASGAFKYDTTSVVISGGDKTLTAALDRVRITRTGTDNFDAGSVNISVET